MIEILATRRKILLTVVLLCLLLADLTHSFLQHYYMPLDGDLAESVVPAPQIEKVLHDPFGMTVLLHGESYPNPNRVFSHWSLSQWFRNIPIALQTLMTPLDSIYATAAIAKIIVQFILILCLAWGAVYFSGSSSISFLVAAVLISPLFQIGGYNTYMGIIDRSVSYTFFYALPMAWLLIFVLGFIILLSRPVYPARYLLLFILMPLAIILNFSGPLVPPIILIGSVMLLFNQLSTLRAQSRSWSEALVRLKSKWHFSVQMVFFVTVMLALYSMYIGLFNSYSADYYIPIIERYRKLPMGIWLQFTQKAGYPLLLLLITINYLIIRFRHNTAKAKKLFHLLKWTGVFAVIYILLLPLGGYKDYRPNIMRYDTIMPVTILFLTVYAASSLYLLQQISRFRIFYVVALAAFLLIFTLHDKLDTTKNRCEKNALIQIIHSENVPVPVEADCTILAWKRITDPSESFLNAKMLVLWRLTDKPKPYFQPFKE